MRTLRFALALVAGLATASVAVMPVEAEAASKTEIKGQKSTVKAAKKDLKTFQKLRAKWEKATSKGKDTSAIEADIRAAVKRHLGMLRKNGIPSKPSENPETWGERFRNALVAVRDAKREKRMRNQMKLVEGFLAKRVERQEKKLDKMGG